MGLLLRRCFGWARFVHERDCAPDKHQSGEWKTQRATPSGHFLVHYIHAARASYLFEASLHVNVRGWAYDSAVTCAALCCARPPQRFSNPTSVASLSREALESNSRDRFLERWQNLDGHDSPHSHHCIYEHSRSTHLQHHLSCSCPPHYWYSRQVAFRIAIPTVPTHLEI